MTQAIREDITQDVIIRVSQAKSTIIIEERKPGGIIAYREVSPLELYYAINGSYTSNDFLETGFLPEHCLHVAMSAAERCYVIWNPELRADVTYRDTEYQNFPIPRLVFGLRVLENGKVAECSMGVVADESRRRIRRCSITPFPMSIRTERCVRETMCCPAIKSSPP